jgi:hypothetical protein
MDFILGASRARSFDSLGQKKTRYKDFEQAQNHDLETKDEDPSLRSG